MVPQDRVSIALMLLVGTFWVLALTSSIFWLFGAIPITSLLVFYLHETLAGK